MNDATREKVRQLVRGLSDDDLRVLARFVQLKLEVRFEDGDDNYAVMLDELSERILDGFEGVGI